MLWFFDLNNSPLGFSLVRDNQCEFCPNKVCTIAKVEGWLEGGGVIDIELPQLPYIVTETTTLVIRIGDRDD